MKAMDGKFIFVLLAVAGVATLAGGRPGESSEATVTSVSGGPATAAQPKREMNMGSGFSIPRSPDGHFYADGQVNGVTVHFLIDSGASTVALTASDAARIGKHVGPGDMTQKVLTANGEAAVAPITLETVTLGSVTVGQVDGVVAGDGLGISLLGQSYLARVGKVSIENDRMTLN